MHQVILLGLATDPLVLAEPTLHLLLQQLGFQAAEGEQLIHAQQLIAQIPVIDIAFNRRQDLRQRLGKGNNSWT